MAFEFTGPNGVSLLHNRVRLGKLAPVLGE